MKISYAKNYQELSELVKNEILKEIIENNEPNICVATGNSVTCAYDLLTKEIIDNEISTNHVSFTKLDEWCNLKVSSQESCEYFIENKLLNKISYNNYYSLNADASDIDGEMNRVSQLLSNDPIDLCILGLGKNGHLGLNEPCDNLIAEIHVAKLDEITTHHSMLKDNFVNSGVTLGMRNILSAKKILFIVAGENKKEIYEKFLEKNITTSLPASFLWLHNNVTMIVQNDLFPI